jgi:hypothetical protein
MKLFITNKEYFESIFDDFNSTSIGSKSIHLSAYNTLFKSVELENSIPINLVIDYDENGVAIFDFITKKGDIYFYTFNGTAK